MNCNLIALFVIGCLTCQPLIVLPCEWKAAGCVCVIGAWKFVGFIIGASVIIFTDFVIWEFGFMSVRPRDPGNGVRSIGGTLYIVLLGTCWKIWFREN